MDLSKTLFITDLDGTLLGQDAALAPADAACLNALTERGVRITYATARTIASVRHILADIVFRADAPPVALMNGVLLRDMYSGIYLDRAIYTPETAEMLLCAMTEARAYPFIYALSPDGEMMTYYKDIPNAAMQRFMEERVTRYGKPFRKIDSAAQIDGDIIYFCLVAPEPDVRRAEAATLDIPHIRKTAYRDHYDTSVFYLEIFDERASKAHAVEFLRAYTGAETVVCFGDNLNDLPMFSASDIRCAVRGAHPDLIAKADHIIDNVPDFIREVCNGN